MSTKGFVYLLQTPFGIKIGKAKIVTRRIKQLSKQYEVRFMHAIYTDDAHTLERALHNLFVDKRVRTQESREIFALSLQDVEWIRSIRNFKGVPCQHIESLTDAVRHSLAMNRQFFSS